MQDPDACQAGFHRRGVLQRISRVVDDETHLAVAAELLLQNRSCPLHLASPSFHGRGHHNGTRTGKERWRDDRDLKVGEFEEFKA